MQTCEYADTLENLLDAIAAGFPRRFDTHLTQEARWANHQARERRRGEQSRVAIAFPLATKYPQQGFMDDEEDGFGPHP